MSGLMAASGRAAIAGEGGPASRARRAGLLMPQSWTLDAFRERLPRPHKLEGRGFRCPCPIHGGTDRAWIRPGGRVAVMGGCNSGCKLPDMARAVGLLASGQPDVFAIRNGRIRLEAPEEGATRNAGYPDPSGLDPSQLDPGRLARSIVHSPVLAINEAQAELGVWAEGRGLCWERLEDSGWRGIDGPERWSQLDELLPKCGWMSHSDGRPRWPMRINKGPALVMPYRDATGQLAGVRFRRLEARKEDKLNMPGDTARLYGAEVLEMLAPGAIVHVAEGESDTESLREHGATAIGTPGNTIWWQEWTRSVLVAESRRVVLWPDPGESGGPFVEKISGALRRFGIPVRVMRPHPGAEADVSDLQVAGRLLPLIREAEA